MPAVSLDSFAGVAGRFAASSPDQALRLGKDNNVTDAGKVSAYFGKEANRATMDSFIDAVKDKYGESAGSLIRNMLQGARESGKPLTARMAQDLIRAGQQRAVLHEVQSFINNGGLDRAVGDICANTARPISAQADKDALKSFLMLHLVDRAKSGAISHPLSQEKLQKLGLWGTNKIVDSEQYIACRAALTDNPDIPEGVKPLDKLRLVELGLRGDALQLALPALGAMREAQATGALKPATVLQVLFPDAQLSGGLDETSLPRLLQSELGQVFREKNLSLVREFIQSPALDKAVENKCRSYTIPQGYWSHVKERITRELLAKAEAGITGKLLTWDILTNNAPLSSTDPKIDMGLHMEDFLNALGGTGLGHLGGAAEDRLRLAELGLAGRALQVAARGLEQMRAAQPNAPLKPETVWKAIFADDSPPRDLTEKNLGSLVDKKLEDDFTAALKQRTVKDKDTLKLDKLAGFLGIFSWPEALEMVRHPSPVKVQDFGNMNMTNDLLKLDLAQAQHGLQVDIPRMTICGLDAGDANYPTPTCTFAHADKSTAVAVGNGALNSQFEGFARADGSLVTPEEDRDAYINGNESSVSRRLEANAREICGGPAGNEAQIARVLWCMTQAPLVEIASSCSLCNHAFTDHANADISFSRGENGAVLAEYATAEVLNESSGGFRMTLNILPDGRVEPLNMEFWPRGQARPA